MKSYCLEAAQYGEIPQPAQQRFKKVLVILNPVADKRSGAKTVCPHTIVIIFRLVYFVLYTLLHERNRYGGAERNHYSMFYVFQFDEYCAPILHLAGIPIDVVKTDSEGHARRYIEELESLPETILVAGGDGTVSEAVTGKLDQNCQ